MLEKNDLTLISEVVSEAMKEAIAPISEQLNKIDARLDEMDISLEKVDAHLEKTDERLDNLEKEITRIRLTLENETNRNIKIIAEGHTDLSRRFHEALRVENERELLLIRVNRMENEIEKLKEKIEGIA